MATLTYVDLVTPERVLYSGQAEAVVLRADGAETAFLANHMDYVSTVDVCVVRIQGVPHRSAGVLAVQDGAEGPSGAEATSTDEIRAAVHGGFVKVAHNKVTIVAGVAELASQIDVPRAQRALEAAQNTVAGDAGEDAVAVAARDAAERAKVRLEAAASLVATLGAAGA